METGRQRRDPRGHELRGKEGAQQRAGGGQPGGRGGKRGGRGAEQRGGRTRVELEIRRGGSGGRLPVLAEEAEAVVAPARQRHQGAGGGVGKDDRDRVAAALRHSSKGSVGPGGWQDQARVWGSS